ncbi:hypothetical protein [Granulicella arctica]|uniref:Uncharacterized protein n=1 Tax=Granulicella arctica TaxID=940613 RepID=A0A7Y9TJL0_9BACT|nr:hypothetical protein [Granulicella arctica]NYF78387.1 hypothetical protein [Granulicella arctica]
MKNIMRALVIALALTGAVASTHTSTASAQVVTSKLSAMPVPTCDPNGTDTCGMERQ